LFRGPKGEKAPARCSQAQKSSSKTLDADAAFLAEPLGRWAKHRIRNLSPVVHGA
jgi:hypothetical protein